MRHLLDRSGPGPHSQLVSNATGFTEYILTQKITEDIFLHPKSSGSLSNLNLRQSKRCVRNVSTEPLSPTAIHICETCNYYSILCESNSTHEKM